jgi:4-amino-4-deoxy-L-arabinose transferase-like glycosyltransferase
MDTRATPLVSVQGNRRFVDAGLWALVAIAAIKLGIHLYASRNYGYFRDELYYLACGDHLDWGYVDQPPLVALIIKIERWLFGDSLTAIRVGSALAGAAKVFLTGFIARELGGKSFAQILAALAVLAAPGFLAIDSFFSMNPIEALLWTACAFVLVRIIKTGNQKLWLWFGLLAGIGLENKHSMLVWGVAIVAGLLLTPQRQVFRSPWIWIAGLLAGLIFLPNLIWNVQHHFPFLELQENIRRSGRNASQTPFPFFGQEALSMNPVALPIWLAGLWFYFFSKIGKPFRVLGWAWVFATLIILALDPRVYYLYPAFPVLLAGGSVACELGLARLRWKWVMVVYAVLIALVSTFLARLPYPYCQSRLIFNIQTLSTFSHPQSKNGSSARYLNYTPISLAGRKW